MARYRKLLAAVLGLLVIVLGPQFLGLSPEGTIFGLSPDQVMQTLVAVLTALGVWGLPNDSEPA